LTFTFVAFVVTIVCIFAGNHAGYLEDTHLLTLNTSMLGEFTFNKTGSDENNGGLLSKTKGKLNNAENEVKNDIQEFVNGAIKSIAEALDIHDFYSMHMLDYCEGYYEPGPVANATNSDITKNVTYCSNPAKFFTFDPANILTLELKHGINLSDLNWPQEVDDAVKAVRVSMRAMFVLYCLAVGLTGLGFFTSIVSMLTHGKVSTMVNAMIAFLACFTLLISSSVATGVARKIVGAVNHYGNKVGVEAYLGIKFLALTWVSTVLMLFSTLLWLVLVRRSGGVPKGKSAGGATPEMAQNGFA